MSISNFRTILQSLSLKVTPARLGILDFLAESGGPVDVEAVYKHLAKEHIEADRATVYRILDIFYQKGIITRFEFQEGKFRYELAGSDHHHLICEECGKIEDIADCGIEELEKTIKRKKGFLVKRHALEFFGLCKTCQQ